MLVNHGGTATQPRAPGADVPLATTAGAPGQRRLRAAPIATVALPAGPRRLRQEGLPHNPANPRTLTCSPAHRDTTYNHATARRDALSAPPSVAQWTQLVATQWPPLSRPQATVLALWSLGLVLARACSLTAVSAFVASLQDRKENTVRQQLREWCYEAPAKRGTQR